MLRDKVAPTAVPERLSSEIAAALRAAEANPSGLSTEHALTLMTAEEGPALEAVAKLADDLRRDAVGDEVTYVVNRNINFTNICYTGCRFCAFAQRKTDADAYTLSWTRSPPAPTKRCRSVRPRYACRAASIRRCPARRTSTSRRAVKKRPNRALHVHAFSPMEIMNGVARTGDVDPRSSWSA